METNKTGRLYPGNLLATFFDICESTLISMFNYYYFDCFSKGCKIQPYNCSIKTPATYVSYFLATASSGAVLDQNI